MSYNTKRLILVNAGHIFTAMLIIVPLLILVVYLNGKSSHRELYLNALLSTTLLSALFLILSVTGLYFGWKLKDNMVGFKKKIRVGRTAKFTNLLPDDFPDIDGDGIGGFIISVILGIILSIVLAAVLWLSIEMIGAALLITGAFIYSVLFRLLRWVFKNRLYCKEQILNSLKYGTGYTIAYSIPVYVLIILAHLLVQAFT